MKKYKALILVLSLIILGVVSFHFVSLYKEEIYQDKYDEIVDELGDVFSQTEKASVIKISVWKNSIYKTSDDETDEYTKNDKGVFYSDFNDALQKLNDSEKFNNYYKTASKKLNDVSRQIKELNKPSSKYTKAFDELLEFYSLSNQFFDLTFNSIESLQTFTEKQNQLDNDVYESYGKALVYSSYYLKK